VSRSPASSAGVVVFGNNKYGHDQITFASFLSLSTSVATSGTLMPAPRFGLRDLQGLQARLTPRRGFGLDGVELLLSPS